MRGVWWRLVGRGEKTTPTISTSPNTKYHPPPPLPPPYSGHVCADVRPSSVDRLFLLRLTLCVQTSKGVEQRLKCNDSHTSKLPHKHHKCYYIPLYSLPHCIPHNTIYPHQHTPHMHTNRPHHTIHALHKHRPHSHNTLTTHAHTHTCPHNTPTPHT